MIKLTNAVLIGLISAGFLVGCGGGSDSDNGVETNEGTEQVEGTQTNEGTEQVEGTQTNEGTEQVEGTQTNGGTEQVEGTQAVEPNNGTGGTTQTPTAPPADTPTTSASKTFGSNVMPVLVAKCQSCHGSNGNFTVTTASNTYSNIVALKGSATAGGQYLLDKGAGTVGHGGGTVIATSSAEYATIKSWVDAGAANN